MSDNYKVIGHLTIERESDPITENHTYYAADHRTFTVQPGTYEIRLSGDWVLVTVDVMVTADVTYNGFGGVNYSSQDACEDGPREGTKTWQLYDYEVARTLSAGTALLGGEAKLAPGWQITITHTLLRPLHDGEAPRTYIKRRFEATGHECSDDCNPGNCEYEHEASFYPYVSAWRPDESMRMGM